MSVDTRVIFLDVSVHCVANARLVTVDLEDKREKKLKKGKRG